MLDYNKGDDGYQFFPFFYIGISQSVSWVLTIWAYLTSHIIKFLLLWEGFKAF